MSSFSTISIISIHALREEGDAVGAHAAFHKGISIHALREEGDTNGLVAFANGYIFLSTPSARRATMPHPHLTRDEVISIHALREEGDCSSGSKLRAYSNFYPRPPRGGRPAICPARPSLTYFYPRPPRGGRRPASSSLLFRILFLSTPSARRATGDVVSAQHIVDISIHALREEGDAGAGKC